MKELPVECLVPSGDICGEAATWSSSENALYWVDINRFLIHRFERESKNVRSYFFDQPVVALSLTSHEGTLLVALADRLILWEVKSDKHQPLVSLPSAPQARFNDGRSDPNGRFWIGTMSHNVGINGEDIAAVAGLGELYCYAAVGAPLRRYAADIGISNTLCWSPDRKTFYFGDTLKNEILAYRYNEGTGEISEPKVHFSGFDRGLPDGSAIDSEGYLWNCRFGGGCIVRIAPDGEIDRIIGMPVKNITTCTFGGEDLKTLYITTASVAKAASDRLAGSLFSLNSPVAGLEENRFVIND